MLLSIFFLDYFHLSYAFFKFIYRDNLVKVFNKNLSTQFQVYWLKILNKDRFGHSVSNKLNLYSEIKN